MTTNLSFLGALFLTGLAGSIGHCLGMCGPLLVLVGARLPKQGIASAPYHVIYHTGRIFVYTILGLISGILGGALEKVMIAAKIPGVLSLVIGLLVIFLGLNYLGVLPFWKRSLNSNGAWQRLMKNALATPGMNGVLVLGMLNGILPCGLVYESLFIAGASGNPWLGALGMFLFGLATLPALVIFGVGAQMLSSQVRKWLLWIGGVFVILVGVLLILRGLKGLGIIQPGGGMGSM